jgi:hypothetical protein
MFMKRLFPTNMCHAVPKRIWSSNTIYDAYHHKWNGYSTSSESNIRRSSVTGEFPTDLSQVPFYCSTPSSNKVFICLSQGKDALGNPSPSIVNPELGTEAVPGTGYSTDVSTNIKYCSDGYTWLLLGDSTDLIAQFDTLDYYPVQTAITGATGNTLNQLNWQTSAAGFKGGVYAINVLTSGSGYNGGAAGNHKVDAVDAATNSHVQIVGDGYGIEYVVIYKSGGGIDKIVVTNPGSGYTWASVVVAGVGSGATAEAVLTPLYGLGTDPVKTLGAYNLIMQISIYDDENVQDNPILHGVDFTIDNDYRKICLVSNVKTSNGDLAESSKLDMTYALINKGGANPSVSADTVLIRSASGQECKVRVVDSGVTTFESTSSGIVRVIQTEYDKPASGPNIDIIAGTYGAYTCTHVIEPNALRGSGDMIYTDYRRPVTRSRNQSEEFKIVIEF